MLFAQWKAVLPNKRPFKRSDRVCERHFEKNDILTTWDHNINGVLHKLERGKAKLKPKSVPCLKLDDKSNMISPNIARNSRNNVRQEFRKRKPDLINLVGQNTRIPATTTNNVEVGTCKMTRRNFLRPAPVQDLLQQPTEQQPQKEKEEKLVSSEHLSVLQEDTPDPAIDDSTEEVEDSSFEFIFDDVYEVVLPCTMYGIHRDPARKFIVFSRFDVDTMSVTKALYVDHRLQAKIFINNVSILCERLPELTVELLTSMLSQLDAQKLCQSYTAVSTTSSHCNVVAIEGTDYCNACAQ